MLGYAKGLLLHEPIGLINNPQNTTALLFFGLSGALILALSIHLQVGRWPLAELGLQPELFNGTRTGGYDSYSNTVNATGLYVASILNVAGIAIGSITVLITFPL